MSSDTRGASRMCEEQMEKWERRGEKWERSGGWAGTGSLPTEPEIRLRNRVEQNDYRLGSS